jgi:DNA repair protein RecO (recombination protein O)
MQGIILNKFNYRENDRLFIIFTDKFGKIEVLARGVKKIKSKMAPHLVPFSIVRLTIIPGKNYYQLIGAEIFKNFLNLKENLVRIVLASYCLEVVDQLTKIGQNDLRIMKLLFELFEILNRKEKVGFLKLRYLIGIFVFKFLSYLGFAPELFFCTNCRKEILLDQNNFFNIKRGGLVCEDCRKEGILVSKESIKILRITLEDDIEKISRLDFNEKIFKEIINVTDKFLEFYQENELKSARWLISLASALKV